MKDVIKGSAKEAPWDPRFNDVVSRWQLVENEDGVLIANLRIPKRSNYRDVFLFHEKFGLAPPERPQLLDTEMLTFREKFMAEEYDEFFAACIEEDLPAAADALVDLVYVIMGTAVLMGLPWQELWDEVQKKNMEKVRATAAEQSKRGSALDVVKPEGWEPPDHAPTLKRHGWKP